MTSSESSDLQKALRLIPTEFHEQVKALPPDKLQDFLQQVLQAAEVEYRQLTSDDIETIKLRTNDSFQYGFRPEDVDFTWEELSQEGYIALGAFSNLSGETAPVGFVVAELFQISDQEAFWDAAKDGVMLAGSSYRATDSIMGVYFVGVDLEYRRQGIAHTLLDYVKEVALGARARMMWLQVNENNSAAVAFYEAYGFAKTDESAWGIRDKHYLYVMELNRKKRKAGRKLVHAEDEAAHPAADAPAQPPAPASPSKGV